MNHLGVWNRLIPFTLFLLRKMIWFSNCFSNSLMEQIKFKNRGSTVFASQIFRRWEGLGGITAANVDRILFQRGWR